MNPSAKLSIEFSPLFPFPFVKVSLNFILVLLSPATPTQLGIIVKFNKNAFDSVCKALTHMLNLTALSRQLNLVGFNLFVLTYLYT